LASRKLLVLAVAGIVVLLAAVIAVPSAFPKANSTSQSTSLNPAGLYSVTFVQQSPCGPGSGWGEPWQVMLGNQTKTEPPNAALPHPDELNPTTNESISMIVFAVGNGTYNYVVSPDFLFPSPGTVNVNGSNVVIPIMRGYSCPPVTSSSSKG
jgi:hypothetical protein